jgi:3-hydroxyanthranilate 3,4-dioxygenase
MMNRKAFWFLNTKEINSLFSIFAFGINNKNITVMAVRRAFNFKKWIDENRHLLKPPVGNQQVYLDTKDFIVMVVGGPNSRKDYHLNEGEEFFYQLEGDIVVKIIEDGKPVDIPIKEGEIFLLPSKVPHSPQRGANTVGLVMEVIRQTEEKDGFLWYCENCGEKLYEEYEHITDIVKQLPPIMNKFYSSLELRTCKKCGTVMEPPTPAK